MTRFTAPLLACVVMLTGCGSSVLQVRVSVLNPEYLDEYRPLPPIENLERQAKIAETAITADGVLGSKNMVQVVKEISKAYDLLYKTLIKHSGLPAGTPPLSPAMAEITSEKFRTMANAMRAGIEEIQTARTLPESELAIAFQHYESARTHFLSAQKTLEEFRSTTFEELRFLRNAAETRILASAVQRASGDESKLKVETATANAQIAQIDEAVDNVRAVLNINLSGATRVTVAVTANADTRADPLLGYVVRAPDDAWAACSIKRTRPSMGRPPTLPSSWMTWTSSPSRVCAPIPPPDSRQRSSRWAASWKLPPRSPACRFRICCRSPVMACNQATPTPKLPGSVIKPSRSPPFTARPGPPDANS